MLAVNKLSYWERNLYFNDLDFVIIGAGLVGYSTALELKSRFPDAKILLLERGYLPSGASTKNAGFACFGSPTEILSDIEATSIDAVSALLAKRYQGLQILLDRCDRDRIDYQNNGSFELFLSRKKQPFHHSIEQLSALNKLVESATGLEAVYRVTENSFGFRGISGIIANKAEGQIDTGKMMKRLHQLVIEKDIQVLFGIEVANWEESSQQVILNTTVGEISTKQLAICTNGFTQQLIPSIALQPARAQVLITEPIPHLKWKGTFHYDAGYYYFRNIDNRILLGGGRNLDIRGETTTDMEQTQLIQQALETLLAEVIYPNSTLKIANRWSGIMGVGAQKSPIVKKCSPRTAIGVRMGGMGVALGSLVGKEVAELF